MINRSVIDSRRSVNSIPRYGYLMLHAMLKSEGLVVEPQADLPALQGVGQMQVRTKRRKKLARPRIPMAVADTGQRTLVTGLRGTINSTHGRRIRILNIVDDYSRTCVGQLVDTSISGLRVRSLLG